MKKLSILFIVLSLCPIVSQAQVPPDCIEFATEARNNCLSNLANQCEPFCQAVAEYECTQYAYNACSQLGLGDNPYCLQTMFQQAMSIIAPQVIYDCTLQYLEGTQYTCDGVYEDAYISCMNNQ